VSGAESCDDANLDETDGCLSTCVIPTMCSDILAELPGAPSDAYTIHPDGMPMVTWCDMDDDNGGWTLVAKINHANTDLLVEPKGWFGMTIAGNLENPNLVLNDGLASHGAGRFAPVLMPVTLARFDLHAADDTDQSASFYKRVASADSFVQWFDADSVPSEVCTNLDMTLECADDVIASVNGFVTLGNMNLMYFGYTTDLCGDLTMRLDDNDAPAASGVCSCTEDHDNNAWADTYNLQWGNALTIWIR
jgi:hypothetical protein